MTSSNCGPATPTSSSPDNLTHTFSLARTCAPAGAEGPYGVTITLTSACGVTGTVTGARNVDDKGPTTSEFTISYPAAATGPAAYGHDGQHFGLNDGNVVIGQFSAYDCGAGLSNDAAHPPTVVITGSPTVRSVTVADATPHDCGGGRMTPNRTFTVTADFRTAAAWSYNWDATPSVAVSVPDLLGLSSNVAQTVNLTRRLWSTQSLLGVVNLAVGPQQVFGGGLSGLVALSRSSGTQVWTRSGAIEAGPSVAPNGGNAVVYFATVNSQATFSGASANASSYVEVSTCATPSTLDADGNPTDLFQQIALLADGSTAVTTDFYQTCGAPIVCDPDTGICSCTVKQHVSNLSLGPSGGCGSANAGIIGPASAIGRGTAYGITYLSPAGRLAATSLVGGANPSIASGGNSLIAMDDGGVDTIVSNNGGRWDFNGTAFTASGPFSWTGPLVGLATPQRILGMSGSSFGLWNYGGGLVGTQIAAGPLPRAVIDGSRPIAVAYLAWTNGTGVLRPSFVDTTNGFTGGTPLSTATFPANIDDVVLAGDGTLYVAAGGAVFALATDSPGVGTQSGGQATLGWPMQGRDACRSYNLAFACPY
jgi:hypothetical protein